ncbi:hypothetical protein [Sulfurospirillum arcachonense]|uniref:hypothetical protein n=1 Tax=Sulfurospirillum arcachonense TaxID=57666 RepID=UPI0004685178|nr:hypothetical protein [Sulfurospirillum arcachonense]
MSYRSWTLKHAKKHEIIVQKLKNRTVDEIIEYFLYDNMIINEPEFCPLYKQKKKCHDMEDLNCYLCACPNFRFKDEVGFKEVNGKKLLSFCSINSKKGSVFKTEDAIHQDCSNCTIPHKDKYIKKHFNLDWKLIMKDIEKEN